MSPKVQWTQQWENWMLVDPALAALLRRYEFLQVPESEAAPAGEAPAAIAATPRASGLCAWLRRLFAGSKR